MREPQKKFFALPKTSYTEKKNVMAQAKALEKVFDQSTEEVLSLFDNGFQPELFR